MPVSPAVPLLLLTAEQNRHTFDRLLEPDEAQQLAPPLCHPACSHGQRMPVETPGVFMNPELVCKKALAQSCCANTFLASALHSHSHQVSL